MTEATLQKAAALQVRCEAHEDFISNADYFIRNVSKDSMPVVDRWFEAAFASGVLTAEDLKMLMVDLRDIATQKLADLDKELEAL